MHGQPSIAARQQGNCVLEQIYAKSNTEEIPPIDSPSESVVELKSFYVDPHNLKVGLTVLKLFALLKTGCEKHVLYSNENV